AAPFWIRRISRLWPASITWALVVLVVASVFNRSGVFGTMTNNVEYAIAGIFQIENFHLISCLPAGAATPCQESALGIYWSLSLEEQFYVLFPFLLFFLRRRTLVFGLLAVIASQFFTTRTWPSMLWFTRTDAICFGILIAFAHERHAFDRVD